MKRHSQSASKLAAQTRSGADRELRDLVSVGPATARELHALGVHTVKQLGRARPDALYETLSRIRRKRQDPCVLDVFTAAVAQARNPALPAEKCQWWYWSRERKRVTPRR